MVFTHGRYEYLERTLESAVENLKGNITQIIVNDDNPEGTPFPINVSKLGFPNLVSYSVLYSNGAGFGGAIRNAWNHFQAVPTPFVFHLEDDFTFNEPIDLQAMSRTLDRNGHLAQLALMRQPWNTSEIQAGSVWDLHKNAWLQQGGYVQHQMWFTTNPCLYKGLLPLYTEWPSGNESEGFMTWKLQNLGLSFGYLGSIGDQQVTHIGIDRGNGKGY